MSLEKDIEEMYAIVQEIKQKEADVLKLKDKLKALRYKGVPDMTVSSGVAPQIQLVAVATHRRGRPRKTTTTEPTAPPAASDESTDPDQPIGEVVGQLRE